MDTLRFHNVYYFYDYNKELSFMDTKKILDTLIGHPLLTSLMVTCAGLLTLMHPLPWFLSFVLIAVVIAVALFYGQKMSLFDQNSNL